MNKNKTQNAPKHKAKNLGAIAVKPQFTVDRLFIYIVGGAATLAGLYVISRFVQQGLKENEKKTNFSFSNNMNNDTKKATTYASDDYQMGLSKNEMIFVQQHLMANGYNLGYPIATGVAGPNTKNAMFKEMDKMGISDAIEYYNIIAR